MKECYYCREELPSTPDYFYRDKQKEDGLDSRCKDCADNAPARKTPAERFWDKVDRGGPNECWEWQAGTISDGYGSFWTGKRQGYAHRYSYRIHKGDPGDLFVLHHCDNPPCVNPNHLWAGTQADNVRDAVEKDRRNDVGTPQVGSKNPRARLTEEDVRSIRDRYGGGGVTQEELADEFRVSQTTIGRVVKKETWGHVD